MLAARVLLVIAVINLVFLLSEVGLNVIGVAFI